MVKLLRRVKSPGSSRAGSKGTSGEQLAFLTAFKMNLDWFVGDCGEELHSWGNCPRTTEQRGFPHWASGQNLHCEFRPT